jgi:DMSO/TMAO reductase YedYZ heme-binding membrane subunit
MLIMVVLVARLPWLERSAGQDRLVRWHRKVASWAVCLIIAHVVLIVLGYAQAAGTGAWHEFWMLVTTYPYMLMATVGFGLLMMAGISSYRRIRRRIRYETWWVMGNSPRRWRSCTMSTRPSVPGGPTARSAGCGGENSSARSSLRR